MIYEIINPSDAITIETEEPRIAQVVVLLMGRGRLGLRAENESEDRPRIDVPLFAFGGGEEALEEWLKASGIGDLTTFIDKHRAAIIDCLEGLTYGSIQDRRAILKTVGREGLEVWNDEHRSSINDYHACAHSLAERMRDKGDGDAE